MLPQPFTAFASPSTIQRPTFVSSGYRRHSEQWTVGCYLYALHRMVVFVLAGGSSCVVIYPSTRPSLKAFGVSRNNPADQRLRLWLSPWIFLTRAPPTAGLIRICWSWCHRCFQHHTLVPISVCPASVSARYIFWWSAALGHRVLLGGNPGGGCCWGSEIGYHRR